MNTCKPEECPAKAYVHNCVRCHPVVVQCETCKAIHHFKVGDPERGDHFVRSAPIESWMCPACGAMEMGVDDNMTLQIRAIRRGSNGSTLDQFLDDKLPLEEAIEGNGGRG